MVALPPSSHYSAIPTAQDPKWIKARQAFLTSKTTGKPPVNPQSAQTSLYADDDAWDGGEVEEEKTPSGRRKAAAQGFRRQSTAHRLRPEEVQSLEAARQKKATEATAPTATLADGDGAPEESAWRIAELQHSANRFVYTPKGMATSNLTEASAQALADGVTLPAEPAPPPVPPPARSAPAPPVPSVESTFERAQRFAREREGPSMSPTAAPATSAPRHAISPTQNVPWANMSPFQAFVDADEDDSGSLSLRELRVALRTQSKMRDPAIDALFAACDTSGDGVVTLLEFLRGYKTAGPPPPPAVLEAGWVWAPVDAFIEIDKDLSGTLSLEELRAALRQRSNMSDASIRALFMACDSSGDGMVTVYEFVKGVKKASAAAQSPPSAEGGTAGGVGGRLVVEAEEGRAPAVISPAVLAGTHSVQHAHPDQPSTTHTPAPAPALATAIAPRPSFIPEPARSGYDTAPTPQERSPKPPGAKLPGKLDLSRYASPPPGTGGSAAQVAACATRRNADSRADGATVGGRGEPLRATVNALEPVGAAETAGLTAIVEAKTVTAPEQVALAGPRQAGTPPEEGGVGGAVGGGAADPDEEEGELEGEEIDEEEIDEEEIDEEDIEREIAATEARQVAAIRQAEAAQALQAAAAQSASSRGASPSAAHRPDVQPLSFAEIRAGFLEAEKRDLGTPAARPPSPTRAASPARARQGGERAQAGTTHVAPALGGKRVAAGRGASRPQMRPGELAPFVEPVALPRPGEVDTGTPRGATNSMMQVLPTARRARACVSKVMRPQSITPQSVTPGATTAQAHFLQSLARTLDSPNSPSIALQIEKDFAEESQISLTPRLSSIDQHATIGTPRRL